ncbi:MAG: methyl-accepting chemotaxis protein [Syntrophobacteraceae bacterium]
MSFTIGKKLWLGFISMLLITAALGFFSYYLFFNVSSNTSRLSEHNLPVVKAASSLQRQALQMLISERDALLSANTEALQRTRDHLGELNKNLDAVNLLATKNNDASLDEVTKKVRDIAKGYGDQYEQAVQAVNQNGELSKVMDQRGNLVVSEADDFMTNMKAKYVSAQSDLGGANRLNNLTFEIFVNEKNMVSNSESPTYVALFQESLAQMKDDVKNINKPGNGGEEDITIDSLQKATEEYNASAEELLGKMRNPAENNNINLSSGTITSRAATQLTVAASQYLNFKQKQVDNLAEALFTVSSLYKEVLSARVKEKLYMLTKDETYWNELIQHISSLTTFTDKLISLATVGGSSAAEIDKIKNAQNAVNDYLSTAKAWIENDKKVYQELLPAMSKGGENVLSTVQSAEEGGWKDAEYVRSDTLSVVGKGMKLVVTGILVAAVVGILLSILMVRSVNGPLKRVINGILRSAVEVASASAHVASSSQSLADGASQQTAAIEETSSSLEEISSMVRQNAQNAQLANSSMLETTGFVEEVRVAMKDLTDSMQEMSQSSKEIQKIIKTIDEIAFQTNLLALNAAVEAARAGEAGAGFAVVADEVRNLALRAAEASKHTADLIEGTVKKVNTGCLVVDNAEKCFEKVVIGSKKAGELVNEIAAASSEQAQGIEQVSKAVSEMNQVTQQNAASAEESASASEELSSQSDQMKGFVEEMTAMVGGNFNNYNHEPEDETIRPALESSEDRINLIEHANKSEEGKKNGRRAKEKSKKELLPKQVVPFEETDLREF